MNYFKKSTAAILSVLLCLLSLTVSASAQTVAPNDDSDFSYEVIDNSAKITGFDKNKSGALTIPATLGGYPVTVIGSSAFDDCKKIKSIVIPDCVTTIEANAFKNCIRVKTLTIGTGVKTIQEDAFARLLCLRELYYNAISATCTQCNTPFKQLGVSKDGVSVYFGDLVQFVPSNLFGGKKSDPNSGKISINLAGREVDLYSLLSSGAKFDVETLKIKKVVLGKSVTSVGSYAFAYCSAIESVYFPSSITSIGQYAFSCGTEFKKEFETQTSTAYSLMSSYDTKVLPPYVSDSGEDIARVVAGISLAVFIPIVFLIIPFTPFIKVIDYFTFISEYVIIG